MALPRGGGGAMELRASLGVRLDRPPRVALPVRVELSSEPEATASSLWGGGCRPAEGIY